MISFSFEGDRKIPLAVAQERNREEAHERRGAG